MSGGAQARVIIIIKGSDVSTLKLKNCDSSIRSPFCLKYDLLTTKDVIHDLYITFGGNHLC